MCKISPPKNKETVADRSFFFPFFSAAKFHGKEGGGGTLKGEYSFAYSFVFLDKIAKLGGEEK